jgi:hypothetical protein
MNETNLTSKKQISDSIELINHLREMLSLKKNLLIENQDSIGKIVALSTIQFNKETSNEIAFELMALINLAKIKGNKEAKKRTINLSRWLKQEPPSLTLLKVSNERIAAIRGLSLVDFPWTLNYIKSSFASQVFEEELATVLVLWGKSLSKDLPHFITDIFIPLIKEIKDEKLLLKYLKNSSKFFIPYNDSLPNELAIALKTLSITILELLQNYQNNKKNVIAIHQAAITCLNESWSHVPSLLLQPNFIDSYKNLTLSLNKYKKNLKSNFTPIESATISLIIEKMSFSENNPSRQLLSLCKKWEETFPSFNKTIKILSKNNLILNNFLELSNETADMY